MKKISALFLCLLLTTGLAGCQAQGTAGGEESKLTGTSSDVLASLLEEGGEDFGMTFEDPVSSENSQSYLGLSAGEFTQYVEDASVSTGALSAMAHLVAVIRCKDETAASQVKELVADGFDSGRWVCVFPEESFVVESGNYVLLAATSKTGAEALKTAFSELAGSTGDVTVFYSGLK